MKHLLLILILPFFLSLGKPKKILYTANSSVVPTVTAISYETKEILAYLSSMARSEAIGEGRLGMLWTVQVAINRAREKDLDIYTIIKIGQFDGIKTHRFKPCPEIEESIIPLVNGTQKLHDYYYFFNPKIATDLSFVRWGFKNDKIGQHFGNHYFFKEKNK